MINFMKFKWLYFLLSGLVIVPGIFSLIIFGLKPSIDFTGGSLLELKFKGAKEEVNDLFIEETVKTAGFGLSSVQKSGEDTYLLKMSPISKEDVSKIKSLFSENSSETPEEVRFETVGSILGRELLLKTIAAIFMAAGFILLYVAWVFKDAKFGVCAILAMLHDSLVLLGSFSLLGHFFGVEVDTLFVTATLTILSFSVHDTVVVYDRIRESQKRLPEANFVDLVNIAVTETLSRSLNNSLTIIFMLISLLLLGGSVIRWFAFALLIGTISGTYSSTFTAAPLLVLWDEIQTRVEKRQKG